MNELLKQARQQAQGKDYTGTLKTVEEWLRVEPGQAEALELKRQATEALQRQKRVEELLKAAQGQERSGDYEACLRSATEGLGLDREHKELNQLQQRAQQELEKRRRVNELLKQARQQAQGKDYTGALKTVEEWLRVEPGQAEALELKRQATEALQRQKTGGGAVEGGAGTGTQWGL